MPLLLHRSHLLHEKISLLGDKTMDYIAIPDFQNLGLGGGVLVCARGGDLVLWDSRTVHCNTPALAQRPICTDTPPEINPQNPQNPQRHLAQAASDMSVADVSKVDIHSESTPPTSPTLHTHRDTNTTLRPTSTGPPEINPLPTQQV
jgi:hypothetical protein